MKVLCTGSARDDCSIIQPQPPANSDVDPPGSLIHKARQ
jgi:hypothetical protein